MTRRDLIAAGLAAPLTLSAADSIEVFFESVVRDVLLASPESATFLRLLPEEEQRSLDGRVDPVSDEALHAEILRAKAHLAQLGKFDRSKLTTQQRLSADMLRFQLEDIIGEEPYLDFQFPLNQFGSIAMHAQFTSLMTDAHPVRSLRDAENYLARLNAFPSKMSGAIAMMNDRAKRGFVLPAFISIETQNQLRRFIAPPPAQNILVSSLASRLAGVESLEGDRRSALVREAERITGEKIYPVYRSATDTLATINAKATNDAGIWRLPKGREAYAFFLRRYTTTTMTPEQVHQKGLDEVRRIEASMEPLFRKLGYTQGSVVERYQKLVEDNRYPNEAGVRDRILADYAKILKENNERSLEAFETRPKADCVVVRIPEFQEANAAANYGPPLADGSRPGMFRVPLPGPIFPRPNMKTLTAHEAIPGHHFQIASQVEMKGLPTFRSQVVFRPLSAYAEGWGLYAETLAAELGWYKDDPVSDLGHLNSQLFRAKRLVVDTGIHTKRWTREQSVAYGAPQSEVDRYVVWPGQACSYKIGQLKILELREETKKRLGGRFSLKAFHRVVLANGMLPLTMLEQVVRSEL